MAEEGTNIRRLTFYDDDDNGYWIPVESVDGDYNEEYLGSLEKERERLGIAWVNGDSMKAKIIYELPNGLLNEVLAILKNDYQYGPREYGDPPNIPELVGAIKYIATTWAEEPLHPPKWHIQVMFEY